MPLDERKKQELRALADDWDEALVALARQNPTKREDSIASQQVKPKSG